MGKDEREKEGTTHSQC